MWYVRSFHWMLKIASKLPHCSIVQRSGYILLEDCVMIASKILDCLFEFFTAKLDDAYFALIGWAWLHNC